MSTNSKKMFFIKILFIITICLTSSKMVEGSTKRDYGGRIMLNTTQRLFYMHQGTYVLNKKNFSRLLIRYGICPRATGGCKKNHFYVYAKKTKKTDILKDSVKFFFARERENNRLEKGFIKVDNYELTRKKITISGAVISNNQKNLDGDLLSAAFRIWPKKLKNCEDLQKLVDDKFKPILEKEFSEYLACQD